MIRMVSVIGKLALVLRYWLGMESIGRRVVNGPEKIVAPSNGITVNGNVGVIAIDTASPADEMEAPIKDDETWLNKANNNTFDLVKKDVTIFFPFLTEPKTEETPQLIEFEYFSGCGSLVKSEYTPDRNFSRKVPRQIKGHHVKLDKLHESVGCEDTRHVMVVGSAGAGKTTLVKRYSKMVLQKQVKKLENVRFVLYLEFRNLCGDEKVTVKDVLVDSMFPQLNEDEKRTAFEWMKHHSCHILLAVDGFDQATWNLTGYHRKIGYETQTDMSTVFYNIFSGHLFPQMWLLTSSRDHAIRTLEGAVRPNKTIQLAGFTKPSIENLVKGYGGERGEKIWSALSKMKSDLISFCTIPVFLVFVTSALYHTNDDTAPPDTFSGIMLRVLLNLIRSQHAHKSNAIRILKKLEMLAFKGMREGRVLFRLADLHEFGLTYEDIQDLVITVPAKTRSQISQKFVEGGAVIFFCHQSIQETLAALYISQMNIHSYREFVSTELNKPHWSIVRLLVYGAVLHPDTSEFRREICLEQEYRVSSTVNEEKKNILLRHLQEETEINLTMLAVLHEAGEGANDAIEASVGSINLEGSPLTASNMHIVASITLRRLEVEELNFEDCNLRPCLLEDLMTALMASDTKIYKLSMGGNKLLKASGFRSIGTIVKQCGVEHLIIEDCDLDADIIKTLCTASEGSGETIRSLDVSWNQYMGFEGFVELGELVKKCGVKSIIMRRCDLESKQLNGFELSLKHSDCLIDVLDVGENYALDYDSCVIIGNIVSRHRVHTLVLNNCNMTPKQMQGLERALVRGGPQVHTLKLSVNTDIDRLGFLSLGKIISGCRIQQLHLRHCELSPSDLGGLLSSMRENGGKLRVLDVGWNLCLEEEGCRILGEIVHVAGVEQVIMDNCKITPKQLRAFGNSISQYPRELKILDLSYNKLWREHLDEFLQFMDKISVALKLSADRVEDADWQSFADILSTMNTQLDIEWE